MKREHVVTRSVKRRMRSAHSDWQHYLQSAKRRLSVEPRSELLRTNVLSRRDNNGIVKGEHRVSSFELCECSFELCECRLQRARVAWGNPFDANFNERTASPRDALGARHEIGRPNAQGRYMTETCVFCHARKYVGEKVSCCGCRQHHGSVDAGPDSDPGPGPDPNPNPDPCPGA